jgi:hypothetical protein
MRAFSGLIQASQKRLHLMSRLSGWSAPRADRNNAALHTAEIKVASHRSSELE